jgi:hypothetical protein
VSGYLAGRPPRNKGLRYPADPPRTEEIIAVVRCASEDRHGARVRGLIVVLWRAGLRIREALALTEHRPRTTAADDPRLGRWVRTGGLAGVRSIHTSDAVRRSRSMRA